MLSKYIYLSIRILFLFAINPFFAQTSYTFTNCGATGASGPTQTQVNSTYGSGNTLNGLVTASNGIQTWTVPTTGTYTIEAWGAQGGGIGTGSTNQGGLGSRMKGEFNLTAGEVIYILVGQQGVGYNYAGSNWTASGGGGTFVVKTPYNTNASILLAAGGGGGRAGNNVDVRDAETGTSGNQGHSTSTGGVGGANGNGGSPSVNLYGAGGGGFFTNGGNGSKAQGGFAFVNGGNGGAADLCNNGSAIKCPGGFGGGGCGEYRNCSSGNSTTAGGGGGYSGGGGGGAGGGAGSYNSGTNQSNTAGTNLGHGKVVITGPPCTNPTTAGAISGDQGNCGSFDPSIITSTSLPTGQTGNLEYKWQFSTISSTGAWTDIASNTSTYDPSLISQTTWFRRLARVDCATDWSNAQASNVIEKTINTAPSIASMQGSGTVCQGSQVTYSVPNDVHANAYNWTFPSDWIGSSTTNSITLTANSSGDVTVTAIGTCGNSSTESVTVTTVNGVPAQPSLITGNSVVCSGISEQYSVVNDPTADSYMWILPPNWIGTSTTNSISAITALTNGDVSVMATNLCGSSSPQILSVVSSTIPATISLISGNSILCGVETETYAVINDPTATSYTWTLPANWTGSSTTNSINITNDLNAGDISVVASNACGSTMPQSLTVAIREVPAQPTAISGNGSVCGNSTGTYSVVNDPNADSYSWALPANWTGTSTINSISATSDGSGGLISVSATNICGSSISQTLTVSSATAPAQPSVISGNTNVCGISTEIYSVVNDPTVDTYIWILPANWTGTSTTNSISTTSASNGGDINVIATNSCGTSTAQILTITTGTAPAQPSLISGNSSLCANSTTVYSVVNDPTVDSYTWTLPTNWTGTSTTNSITATSGSNGGDISVLATNSCGSSAVQSLNVTTNQATSSTITRNDCGSSYTLNGQVYSVSGTYTQVINNLAGCDSTITLELTLTAPFTTSISQNGAILTASEAGATSYQWVNCNTGNSPIAGATNQNYTPGNDGNYAVIVTKNACTSTSACYTFNKTNGIEENELSNALLVYPNPSSGIFTLTSSLEGELNYRIYTLSGQLIETQTIGSNSDVLLDLSKHTKGIYILEVTQNNLRSYLKLMKE